MLLYNSLLLVPIQRVENGFTAMKFSIIVPINPRWLPDLTEEEIDKTQNPFQVNPMLQGSVDLVWLWSSLFEWVSVLSCVSLHPRSFAFVGGASKQRHYVAALSKLTSRRVRVKYVVTR